MLAHALRTHALAMGASTLLVALGATGAAFAIPRGLIEMEVLGVVPLDAGSSSILVLRQKGAHTLLPIFVGRAEGAEIERRMKDGQGEQARAPDLLRNSIEALGGKVAAVVIEGAGGKPFRARVALARGHVHRDVDARPSDSVALALASQAPIYATQNVIAESGLTEQELANVHRSATSSSRSEPTDSGRVETF